eukprot:CAMPEP_0173440972 /NCGR_PEP_ID=MMETSP1357-20121228/23707_1 /TAXON_ID=77926 /ORGANISM="Hemiselmis rufescens, Strain PCC563" /LENGTH=161 /DNA_ID=CAMNT_0014406517 /DNA_START=224 /DNA_END=706 /DNA_ORIENTATION=+
MAHNFNDKLQSLLVSAEQFQPGSTERTHSLEQVRSMLLDRGRRVPGGKSGGFSPDDDMLEDFYMGSQDHGLSGSLSAIPETSAADKIWDHSSTLGAFHHDESHMNHDDLDHSTFRMDDVDDSLPQLEASIPSKIPPSSAPPPLPTAGRGALAPMPMPPAPA